MRWIAFKLFFQVQLASLQQGAPCGGPRRAPHGGRRARHGRVVQVDPIRPTLKSPGTKRMKVKYYKPLSNVAFKFNMRRYTTDPAHVVCGDVQAGSCQISLLLAIHRVRYVSTTFI
jgi:hypothetical protein